MNTKKQDSFTTQGASDVKLDTCVASFEWFFYNDKQVNGIF